MAPVVQWRSDVRSLGGVVAGIGWASGAGRPEGTGRPLVVASLAALLLASLFPRFPHGWCSCTLALALLLAVRSVPTIPMHVREWSVK